MQIIPHWYEQRQLYTSSSSDEEVVKSQNNKSQTSSSSLSSSSSVCFAEQDNEVHEILPLSAYTSEEIRSCWFTRNEYNSFKRNSLVTLSLNRSGQLSPDDPEHTMRGLECRTRECTDTRRIVRYRAAAAVFDEQAKQNNMGYSDPEALSESYHAISWHSMYDSHTQGMADEQDIQSFVSAPTTTRAAAEEEQAQVQKDDEVNYIMLSPVRRTSSKKRNTVFSKIISIEPVATDIAVPEIESDSFSSSSSLITGLDCRLFANVDHHDHYQQQQQPSTAMNATTPFNLNAFFNDMSLGIAVAAA